MDDTRPAGPEAGIKPTPGEPTDPEPNQSGARPLLIAVAVVLALVGWWGGYGPFHRDEMQTAAVAVVIPHDHSSSSSTGRPAVRPLPPDPKFMALFVDPIPSSCADLDRRMSVDGMLATEINRRVGEYIKKVETWSTEPINPSQYLQNLQEMEIVQSDGIAILDQQVSSLCITHDEHQAGVKGLEEQLDMTRKGIQNFEKQG